MAVIDKWYLGEYAGRGYELKFSGLSVFISPPSGVTEVVNLDTNMHEIDVQAQIQDACERMGDGKHIQ